MASADAVARSCSILKEHRVPFTRAISLLQYPPTMESFFAGVPCAVSIWSTADQSLVIPGNSDSDCGHRNRPDGARSRPEPKVDWT